MHHGELVFASPKDVNTKAAEELLRVNTIQWKKKKNVLLTSSFKLGNKTDSTCQQRIWMSVKTQTAFAVKISLF